MQCSSGIADQRGFQPPDAEPEVTEVSDSESNIDNTSDVTSSVGEAAEAVAAEEDIHFGDTDDTNTEQA